MSKKTVNKIPRGRNSMSGKFQDILNPKSKNGAVKVNNANFGANSPTFNVQSGATVNVISKGNVSQVPKTATTKKKPCVASKASKPVKTPSVNKPNTKKK